MTHPRSARPSSAPRLIVDWPPPPVVPPRAGAIAPLRSRAILRSAPLPAPPMRPPSPFRLPGDPPRASSSSSEHRVRLPRVFEVVERRAPTRLALAANPARSEADFGERRTGTRRSPFPRADGPVARGREAKAHLRSTRGKSGGGIERGRGAGGGLRASDGRDGRTGRTRMVEAKGEDAAAETEAEQIARGDRGGV